MTWTRDQLWRTVNERGAIMLVRAHNGRPAGTRGTLVRFGHKYARVVFDGELWPIDVAFWMIARAPFVPVIVGGAA